MVNIGELRFKVYFPSHVHYELYNAAKYLNIR
jgi:hypothetical protein